LRDVYQVLREKEAEEAQLRSEVSALRTAIPLLVEESDIKAASEEKVKVEFP
jgi:hypothetical protein